MVELWNFVGEHLGRDITKELAPCRIDIRRPKRKSVDDGEEPQDGGRIAPVKPQGTSELRALWLVHHLLL